MSITLPKYDLDEFGTNPKNYIKNEKVLIAANCKYLIPDGSPFFVKDVVLTTEQGAIISPSKYKLKGHQYFIDLIGKTGQKVSAFIEITDPTILANNAYLLMTYRTVGKYYIPRNKVPEWLDEIKNAGTGLTFDKILHLPDLFPWNHHKHSAVEEVGDYYELTDFFRMMLGSRLLLENNIGGMIDTEFNNQLNRLATYRDTYHNALIAHRNNYGNAHGITKAMMGLGLVENYSTASISEEVAGISSTLYSTPLGVRSMVVNNVANNVSFLENGVFPVSYIRSFTYTIAGQVLTINNGCEALINGTKYQMPAGTINCADYLTTTSQTLNLFATLDNGAPVWVINTDTGTEINDNFNLIVAKLLITTTTLSMTGVFSPFMIANYEVTDSLSKPGSIVHSSGLPMDEGVYRIQEKYVRDDPYA